MPGLRTVCLFLGPYRNLTTLVASILHLHPTCQTLNHGGMRILPDESLNFLTGYTPEKFNRFCEFALEWSQGGKQGATGGSITLSHAFEQGELHDVFRERYGEALVKPRVESLVWKDPGAVSWLIREQAVDVGELVKREERLRFLMPVRNPLDCAQSNVGSGYTRVLRTGYTDDVHEVLRAILEDLAWFRELGREHPGRFFDFFEHEVDEGLLLALCEFLRLPPDETWIADALRCYQSTAHYEHEPDLIEHYRGLVRELFAEDEAASKLERFVTA